MFRLFHALCDRAEGKAPSTQRETPAIEQLLADNIRLTAEVKRLDACYNDLANKVSVLDAGRFHERSVSNVREQKKSNAEFENWAMSNGFRGMFAKTFNDRYVAVDVERMWRAWQAARRTR